MPSDPSDPSNPSHPSAPGASPTATTYRALLRNREFAGLYVSFALSVSASTLSGFALGTLVHQQTRSPFLTAVSMYGATFATVLGALTLISVADGSRPRRTLVVLQGVASAGAAAQAVLGLPLTVRFGLLAILGFFQSLGTGNWLPAPEGSFNVFLRLYWPDEAALGGAWNPPPLRRTS
ncbi:hypothetical protein ABZ606_12475 [Streptomyces sp. NPDC012461]|uniref:hypothetical protein n=1 Tax=Streptomyces sp. NPDC012461 TaxID=3155117 RepID=UPI00340B3D7F